MKRAILIATGTVGGLGAVLAITPPQLTSSELALPSGGASGDNTGAATASKNSTVSSSSNTSTTSKKATSTGSKSSGSSSATTTNKNLQAQSTNSNTSTSSSTTSPSPSASSSQSNSNTQSSSTKSSATGEFTGSAINVGYGVVQVKITVENGKITDAVAVQAPSGRNDRFTNYAVPILKQQTLAAQSDAISGASGASYTSYGWYKSLQSALSKAGML